MINTRSVLNLIKVVEDSEFINILKTHSLYGKLINGELKCSICGRKLTIDNVGGVYCIGGEIKLVCDNPNCLAKAVVEIYKRKKNQNI